MLDANLFLSNSSYLTENTVCLNYEVSYDVALEYLHEKWLFFDSNRNQKVSTN